LDWERSMRGARYHEAGHAVAAHHHGYTIESVTATAEEWGTNWRRPTFGGAAEAWREACVTLAGQLADHVAAWEEMRPEPWEEFLENAQAALILVDEGEEDARDDHFDLLRHLEEMASFPPGDSLEVCYGEVVEDTRRLLLEHWPEVESVARALEETGSLDGAAFLQALEASAV
jgi:hypothetical protein